MKIAYVILLCALTCSARAHQPSNDQKADWAQMLSGLQDLRDSLINAYDSGFDPVDVDFPNGSSRKIKRSVLKDPRDAQYYAHPDKFPPVGYIAIIESRIAKLQAKIAKFP